MNIDGVNLDFSSILHLTYLKFKISQNPKFFSHFFIIIFDLVPIKNFPQSNYSSHFSFLTPVVHLDSLFPSAISLLSIIIYFIFVLQSSLNFSHFLCKGKEILTRVLQRIKTEISCWNVSHLANEKCFTMEKS